MKEQIIDIPENFKIKKITSNKIILVEKKKKLTYNDIAYKLFSNNHVYWFSPSGRITKTFATNEAWIFNPNNATCKEQLEKLLAINKLMNVAKYVNGDWKPDWNSNKERKYNIAICNNDVIIQSAAYVTNGFICFKDEKAATKAINILGEDTIKLAFSNY